MIAGHSQHVSVRRKLDGRNGGQRGVNRRFAQLKRVGFRRRVILGALPDPTFKQRDFLFGQGVAFLGHVRFLPADFLDDAAIIRFAGFERRSVFAAFLKSGVSRQIEFTLQLVGVMTTRATPFQYGNNVVIKAYRLRVVCPGCEHNRDPNQQTRQRMFPRKHKFSALTHLRRHPNRRQRTCAAANARVTSPKQSFLQPGHSHFRKRAH